MSEGWSTTQAFLDMAGIISDKTIPRSDRYEEELYG